MDQAFGEGIVSPDDTPMSIWLSYLKEIFVKSNFIVNFTPSSLYNENYKTIVNKTSDIKIINDIYSYLKSLSFENLLSLQVMNINFGNIQLSVNDFKSVDTLNISSNEITIQFYETLNLPIYKTFSLIRNKIKDKTIKFKTKYMFNDISISIFKTVDDIESKSITNIETITFYNCIPTKISLNSSPNLEDVNIYITNVTFVFDYFTNDISS